MSLILEFDAKNNILRGTLQGRVTDAILLDSYSTAARYARSQPPCRGIWNLTEVTDFEVSGDTVRKLERSTPIIVAGFMRVIVASRDLTFGMMRMLQILSEESRPELHVVRTMGEAYRLLVADAPHFTPVD